MTPYSRVVDGKRDTSPRKKGGDRAQTTVSDFCLRTSPHFALFAEVQAVNSTIGQILETGIH